MSAARNLAELLDTERRRQEVFVDHYSNVVADVMLGRIVMFGHPKPLDSSVPVYQWYQKRAQVITHWGPDVEGEIGLALQFIREGRINIDPLLTHRFPLDRVHEAYELFADRRDGCVKVVVEL